MATASPLEPGPRTPEDLMHRFSQYIAESQLDQLVALYAPDALFVPQPGVEHRGHAAIRGALLLPRIPADVIGSDLAPAI